MTKSSAPSTASPDKFIFSLLRITAALIVFVLGLLVLIGWYLKNETLIQVLPSFVPMQYNTALGFLLCGAALLLSIWKYRKAPIALSLVIFVIGSLTLSQYIFGIEMGIDELFMRHYINVQTSHPGRMAPNTALCFTLSSIAIFIFSLKLKYSQLSSSLIGSVIMALGFISFFGYLTNIPNAYSWGQLTAMAVHTSFGFVLIGTLLLLTRKEIADGQKGLSLRLPILVAVSGLTISVCLWQAIYFQERANIEQRTRTETDYIHNAISAELKTQILALERMAERWEVRKGIPREEWSIDATHYVNDYGAYQAIEWVDADFIVRWVIPLEGNAKAVGSNLAFEESRRVALEKARDNRTSFMTRPIDLVQGGKGLYIYFPIFIDDKFDGFILGVLRVEDLFISIFPDDLRKEYALRIFDGDEVVFQNGIAKKEASDPFGIGIENEETFETFGVKWKTVVSPKQKISFFSNFSIDYLGLLLGIFITALLSGLVYLYQQSHINFTEKAIANNKLVAEAEERKRIESVLRQTSAFRQAILDSANYMIISTDIDGTILAFNKTAEKLLGYKAEDVIGKFSPEIIHIEAEVLEYAKELNEDGYEITPGFDVFTAKAKQNIVDEREWTYVRKDGTSFPVMLSLSTLRDEDGEITGFLGVGKDITELKEANLKLIQSEERFKTFMNNTPVVAFIRDSEQRYTFINKRFEKRFKIKSKDLIGKTDAIWLSEERALEAKKTDLEIIRTGNIIKSTEVVPKPSGRVNYWMLIKFPIANPDGSTYVGGVAIDISESKHLEEELKEARDIALESAQLKSEFLANMSHEIRTPMNGVIGMTDILLDTTLDDDQKDYARTIQESANSLMTIINDILDFSKIEAGKVVFETIDFNLRNTVESVIGMFTEEVDRKGLEIVSLVEMNVPINLQGDPGRLKQVLINLIGNAIKFTKEGNIYVKVSKLSEDDTLANLRFDIADTGIGIKPETLKFLFQPFTQADGSMTRKYGGTGLGLAISKQFVEIMQGNMSVESELGKGSTFAFNAQFEKQIGIKATPVTPVKSLTNLRALVVDDNAVNREIIIHQVETWGIKANEASSAELALKSLEQAVKLDKPYDIVFLDLMIPDVGGFELAGIIRKNKNFANLKLILMPSFGKRGHAQDAMAAGIDAYLVKPIRQSDLFDCIATVMGKFETGDIEDTKSDKLITRHTLLETRSTEYIRILIAEDNLVNQKVTGSQVKSLGYKSDIVSNGLEVLDAIKSHKYSLILMDCQMPEMNGYEATDKIREIETDGQHIPIIAITANALVGEQEKCLNAGMDDYLAKPFKQEDLKIVIEKWIDQPEIKQVSIAREHIAKRYEFLPEVSERLNELKGEVGEEMVEMITSLFVEDSMLRLKKMHKLVKSKELEGILNEAHSLKGSAGNIGANHVAKLCSDLEIQVNDMSEAKLKEAFAEIESGFFTLFEAIETLDLQMTEDLVKT